VKLKTITFYIPVLNIYIVLIYLK